MDNNFQEIWERIQKEINIKNFTELANIIESSQQYVSKKKKLNKFPIQWAYRIAKKYNYSTDWIMTGRGAKRRFAEPEKIESKNQIIQQLDKWLSEITQDNPEKAIWFKYQIKVAFPEFGQWLKRKEKQIKDNQSQRVA